MGIVIVKALAVVIVVLIAAGVVVYIRRRSSKDTALERGWATKGDLNSRQERALITQVNQAADIFRQLLTPPHDLSGDMTYLRHEDRQATLAWLQQYNFSTDHTIRRGIEQR